MIINEYYNLSCCENVNITLFYRKTFEKILMVSALKSIQKKKKLSEDSKHLAKRSRYQVGLIEDSFNRFGKETGNFEDSEVLFEELRQLESEERNEAIAEVFQKYIDWNFVTKRSIFCICLTIFTIFILFSSNSWASYCYNEL